MRKFSRSPRIGAAGTRIATESEIEFDGQYFREDRIRVDSHRAAGQTEYADLGLVNV